jgi:hypothetical protein
MTGLGARSVTGLALLASVAVVGGWLGLIRGDYWAQLDLWVPFLVGGFSVLCGTLVFGFWRLAERSEYYFRIGDRLAWAAEIGLVGGRGRTLLVGHAPQVEVVELPPIAQRAIYIAIFLVVGVITVNNRAIAVLRDRPSALAAAAEFCPEASPSDGEPDRMQGCQLVIRAYKLGYATSLGSCAPRPASVVQQAVCTKRQRDEPYLHYAWRLLDARLTALISRAPASGSPGMIGRFEYQLDHAKALFDSTLDSVAMQPRSSHHLFTNLPDPRPLLGDRVDTALERGCGARLARLAHFPRMADTAVGPSLLLEHVIDQLVFNPAYQPVIAQCGETIIHWAAPPDTCARLVGEPRAVLAEHGALVPITELLAWRRRKAELAALHLRELGEPEPADRIASLQCLMFGDADEPVVERSVAVDGQQLRVRWARMRPLGTDGGSQIKLYKRLAALLADGFGYGRLTSNESISARPEDATMLAAFGDPALFLTKLELLRDADLFLGNEWLTDRPDLLEVYPYHLHLKNFVEVFRRQYKLHRGRL